MKSWSQKCIPRTDTTLRSKYLTTFFSKNWDKLSVNERAAHSLSNCQACARAFCKEQKSFPLKPVFMIEKDDRTSVKSFIENEFQDFNRLCRQRTGQAFENLANRYPHELGLRDTDAEVNHVIADTRKQFTQKCNEIFAKEHFEGGIR